MSAEAGSPESLVRRAARVAKTVFIALLPLLGVLWANAVLLRLTVRDRIDGLAVLYYATPWPVLAVLGVPFLWVLWKKPWAVFAGIAGVHVLGGLWLMRDWRFKLPAKTPADLRVVQWNIGRPRDGGAAMAGRIKDWNADIVAIAEPLPHKRAGMKRFRDAKENWPSRLPGYEARFAGQSMLLFVRGKILSHSVESLEGRGFVNRCEAEIRGERVTILQADLAANPVHSRRAPMKRLLEIVKEAGTGSLVLLGDFNTPRDSVYFDPIRDTLTNTFEARGDGCGATWPSYLPLLSLDQIWVGSRLSPVSHRHEAAFRTDHRPAIAELAFVREQPAGTPASAPATTAP